MPPLPRIYLSPPYQTGAEAVALQRVLAGNWLAPVGAELKAFEQEMGGYTGLPHPLAVNAGTAALELAYRAAGVGPGALVLAPTFTFAATVAPAVRLGAEVWFVDSDPDSWEVDRGAWYGALAAAKAASRRVTALVSAPVYGVGEDGRWLREQADAQGAQWICDAAEAVGVRAEESHVGHAADFVTLSFNGNKILTTGGGGMVFARDPAKAELIRLWATQGRTTAWHYEHTEVGSNLCLSNVLAALGRAQLEALEENIARRAEIKACYAKALTGLPGMTVGPPLGRKVRSNHWLTCLRLDPKQTAWTPFELSRSLADQGIESRPLWFPLHRQPIFGGACFFGSGAAEQLFAEGLALPSGSGLTRAEQGEVIAALRTALAAAEGAKL